MKHLLLLEVKPHKWLGDFAEYPDLWITVEHFMRVAIFPLQKRRSFSESEESG
jgi:hypothetical protein